MTKHELIIIIVLAIGSAASILTRKLTVGGGFLGGLLGWLVFIGAGFMGIILLSAFFLLGTWATSWGRSLKERLAVAEKHKGRRTAGQVMANGGMAGIAGLLAWNFPQHEELFHLIMAAALSSAMADTLSSELGTVYGRSFYNILSLKKDRRGLDGVVSMEGIIIGIAGSFCIAVIYAMTKGLNSAFIWIIIAGTIGNLVDSFLGATVERKGKLKNNAVNFLNTLAAAAMAAVFYCINVNR